jgi:hypothetical protein
MEKRARVNFRNNFIYQIYSRNKFILIAINRANSLSTVNFSFLYRNIGEQYLAGFVQDSVHQWLIELFTELQSYGCRVAGITKQVNSVKKPVFYSEGY